MLNLKDCRKEGCRRGRNLLQMSPQSSYPQLLAGTGILEDSAIQEYPLNTMGHRDPPHHFLLTTDDYTQ